MAERIQRKRAKGWRMPAGAVYVGRPTVWGNPFAVHQRMLWTPAVVVELYEGFLAEHPEIAEAARAELAGRDLACWCRLDQPCHADTLLRVAAGKKV
jgi:hypothetical protein